jgi:MtN3 and saliva related transmembrane protein
MQDYHIGTIGLLAGFCTTVSFVPQLIKVATTKKVRDISLHMYAVLATGIFLWLVYGILIGEFPVIVANAVSFVLCALILMYKVVYGTEWRRRMTSGDNDIGTGNAGESGRR